MADFISLPFYDLFHENGHVPKIRENLPRSSPGVMYALEPDYRRRLWPVLAASMEAAGLLIFTWRAGGPPAPQPLRELESRQVGRHTYTILSEILDSGAEACRARYVHRITQGDKIISEEELTGYAYRPPWHVLERELVTAGFAQADGAEGLLAWRLA